MSSGLQLFFKGFVALLRVYSVFTRISCLLYFGWLIRRRLSILYVWFYYHVLLIVFVSGRVYSMIFVFVVLMSVVCILFIDMSVACLINLSLISFSVGLVIKFLELKDWFLVSMRNVMC
ncbi:hypothetical protein Hanom_Chr01g00087601 [Helianthus anomalus]